MRTQEVDVRIIVEGPDAAGKSTLIQHIIHRYPHLTLVRNDKEADQDFNNWWLEKLHAGTGEHEIFIHDRFFYSELVYGPVIRGHINARQEVIDKVRDELRKKALLIYCRPPRTTIKRKLGVHRQMLGVQENIDRIVWVYDDLLLDQEAPHYGRRFHLYDYTRKDEPAAVLETAWSYLTGDLQ